MTNGDSSVSPNRCRESFVIRSRSVTWAWKERKVMVSDGVTNELCWRKFEFEAQLERIYNYIHMHRRTLTADTNTQYCIS